MKWELTELNTETEEKDKIISEKKSESALP